MRPRPCGILALLPVLVLKAFSKRVVFDDDALIDVDSSIDNTSIDPHSGAGISPTRIAPDIFTDPGIPAAKLHQLVQDVHPGITLRHYLDKGAFGIAFDAIFLVPNVQPKRCVVKFVAINSKEVGKEKKAWEKIQVATVKHKLFRKRLDELREECELMRHMKQSHIGQLAVAADPSGAGALSECILNCHGLAEDPCRTRESEPPFIVVTYAGDNGAKWVKPESGAPRSPAEVYTVLNQVREGIRFMSEIHHDLKRDIDDPASSPIIHHDLKWDNVCVTNLAPEGQSVPNWRANLIDFRAAVNFVHRMNRTYKRLIATSGYAPPEWYVQIPYDDPPWSFDVYSLGAMTLWAVCDVAKPDLVMHGKELAKLLQCSREGLSLLCVGSSCSSRSGKALDCSLSKPMFDAALAEINFTKPAKDFERFKDEASFHDRLCDRAIPESRDRFDIKRRICKSLWLLMHPNPKLRPRPSSFKFDAHLGHGLPGAAAETWQPIQRQALVQRRTAKISSVDNKRLD